VKDPMAPSLGGGADETSPGSVPGISENMAWRARVTAVRERVPSLKEATEASARLTRVASSCSERKRWELDTEWTVR
jgi:hypothetical protein